MVRGVARFFVVWMALAVLAVAQVSRWARFYDFNDEEAAYAVAEDAAGNLILGGTHSLQASSFLGKILLMKTNAQGDTLWVQRLDSIGKCYAVVATPEGGFVCAGRVGVAGDFFVWKFDSNGNRAWSYRDGSPLSDVAYDIELLDSGKIAVVGSWEEVGAGQSKTFLLLLDSNGQRLLFHRYNHFGGIPRALARTPDKGFAIVGTTDQGAFVAKLDSAGTQVWVRKFGKVMPDEFNDVVVTPDGGILAVGKGVTEAQNGIPDLWVVKLSASGDSVWSRVYGKPDNLDGGAAVVSAGNDRYWIAGHTFGLFSGYDIALWEISGDGTLLDTVLVNVGDGNDWAYGITRTADGGYAVVGSAEGPAGVYKDVVLLKIGGQATAVVEHSTARVQSGSSLRIQGNLLVIECQGVPTDVAVYTLSGQKVIGKRLESPLQRRCILDLSSLPAGVYLCRWREGAVDYYRLVCKTQ